VADLTIYDARQGVSCRGEALVNPQNAQSVATGIQDFTANEEPSLHEDGVIRTLTDTLGSFGATVVVSTVYNRRPLPPQ
jgi:hypothetical protein